MESIAEYMEQITKRMVETEEEIILETLVPWCNENIQIQKQMLINKAELKRALNEYYGKNKAAWIYKSFDEDTGMNYHDRQHRKWFLQYQSDIVRHVHSATTPSGKTLSAYFKCCLVRLWRVGTNTLYILHTTGSWFIRFVVQLHIYSFQCSD